jgi:hypothetical protein
MQAAAAAVVVAAQLMLGMSLACAAQPYCMQQMSMTHIFLHITDCECSAPIHTQYCMAWHAEVVAANSRGQGDNQITTGDYL